MNATQTILTGVKPTGSPHIGNLLGAIRPAIELANRPDVASLLFIADYHAVTSAPAPDELRALTYEVTATWLSLGTDPKKTIVYRQSDVPETFELAWILSCFTEKGLMNRAHAYKAKTAENEAAGRDADHGVNIGLYSYPVLMSADIVVHDAHKVPVGADQVQHLEIARDIVQKLNHHAGKEVLRAPEALVQETVAVVPGLDGRKMSKSYQNTIPIFLESKKLRKLVMKIKTDSSAPEDPKDPAKSDIFAMYKHFATKEEVAALAKRYQTGIGWGEAKEALYLALDRELAGPRAKYEALMADTGTLEKILKEGGARARVSAQRTLSRVRQALGLN
jgi:tryptophanyl-tRNA synthetase